MSNGEQMEDCIRRSACGRNAGNCVFETLASNHLTRSQLFRDEFHDQLTTSEGCIIFGRVISSDAIETHGRNAEKLHDSCHRVRGELPAARARSGASMIFEVFELSERHLARRVRSDGFEDILNRDVVIFESPRIDAAAVERQARQIEPCKRHDNTGIGLVTTPTANRDRRSNSRLKKTPMESAITSRLTSNAFMPSAPIVMPSEMETVLNSSGVPPAALTPSSPFPQAV